MRAQRHGDSRDYVVVRPPAAVRACLLGALALAPRHAAADGTRLPLSLATAARAGEAVVGATWLEEQVRQATLAFRPHGVCFEVAEHHALPAERTTLETRADRHALGTLLSRGVINVFVVEGLRDVDDSSTWRMGVHWRGRGHRRGHWVIVAATAWVTTLAHELGHFFGNPHVPTPGNLMSYAGRTASSGFDGVQGRRVGAHLRRFVRSGELRPLEGGCP